MRTNGHALRALRERTGWTRVDLAAALERQEALRTHADSIGNIELGHRNASPRLITAIARVLRVPVGALLADPEVGRK